MRNLTDVQVDCSKLIEDEKKLAKRQADYFQTRVREEILEYFRTVPIGKVFLDKSLFGQDNYYTFIAIEDGMIILDSRMSQNHTIRIAPEMTLGMEEC